MDQVFNYQFYSNVKEVNESIQNENNNYEEIKHVNQSLVRYKHNDTNNIQFINLILLIIYYILVFIFFNANTLTLYNFPHLIIMLFFITFPFIIYPIQKYLYHIIDYLINLVQTFFKIESNIT
jgi:hypothetical protein